MRRALVVAAVALGLTAPAAHAAYHPHLTVRVDPATPGAPAALAATVTQAPGESATQTERVRFPPAFGFNPQLSVSRCTPAQERAAACPETSRIGTATAETIFGGFAGPVNLTTDFRFVVFLRGFAGLVEQRVSGYLLLQPDGSVDSVLDGLPNVSATRASVAFDSGARSVLLTPRRCGRYVLGAHFVSHSGETVDEDAPVEIGGCDTSPRIEAADVSPARLTGGRRRVRVSWRLAEPGSATVVEVQRIVPAGRFVRWRRELEMRASATAGANQLALALRRHGRPLAPSRYQIVLTTLSARGDPVDVSRLPLTVAG